MVWPRSKLEWVAAALNVMAAAVAVVGLCAGLGVVGELFHRDAAVVAREPVLARSGPFVCPIAQNTQSGALEVIRFGPNATGRDAPPGAPWPAEGTAWVSPRLAQELRSDPLSQALVPGKVAGTIGRSALVGPDDLLAYVGVSNAVAESSPCLAVAGFGATGVDATGVSLPIQTVSIVTVVALAGLGLGLAVLLAAAATLTAAARERRLAAAVLIGLRPASLGDIGALNAAVLALIGVAVGTALTWPASWVLGHMTTFGVRHWSTVALLPWQARVAVGAGVVIAGALLGRRSVGRDVWAIRRRAGERPKSLWRLAPMVIALVVLVYLVVTNLDIGSQHVNGMSGASTIALLVVVGVAAIGFVVAQPAIMSMLGPLFAQAPMAPRLAVARVAHHAASARLVSASLAVGLLGLGVSVGMAADLGARTRYATGSPGIAVVDLPPRVAWAEAGAFDTALQQVFQADTLVWVSARHVGLPPADDPAARPPQVDTTPFTVTDFGQVDDTCEVQAAMAWSDASAVAASAAKGWQSTAEFPYFITGLNQAGDGDNQLQMAVASFGLVLGVAGACLALGVALIGMQVRRDDADAALLALGVSHGRLSAVRAWEAAFAVLPMALVAMLFASLVAVAMQHVDNTSLRIQWSMLIPIVAVPLAVTALVAGIAALTTPGADRAAVRRD